MPTAYEARCHRCGEIFIPANEYDLIHLFRSGDQEGEECGGSGEIIGEWG
jgi:hypothetical protein